MKLSDIKIGEDYHYTGRQYGFNRVRALAIETRENVPLAGDYGGSSDGPVKMVKVQPLPVDGSFDDPEWRAPEVYIRPGQIGVTWEDHLADLDREAAETRAVFADIDRVNKALDAGGFVARAYWDSEDEGVRLTLRGSDLERVRLLIEGGQQ